MTRVLMADIFLGLMIRSKWSSEMMAVSRLPTASFGKTFSSYSRRNSAQVFLLLSS